MEKQQNTKTGLLLWKLCGRNHFRENGRWGVCAFVCVRVCTVKRVREQSSVSNQQVYRQLQYLSPKWNGKLDLGCRDIGQWISLAVWCRLCQARLSIKLKVLYLLSLLQMDLIIRRLVQGCTKINPIHWCLSTLQSSTGGTSSPCHLQQMWNSYWGGLGVGGGGMKQLGMNIAGYKKLQPPFPSKTPASCILLARCS